MSQEREGRGAGPVSLSSPEGMGGLALAEGLALASVERSSIGTGQRQGQGHGCRHGGMGGGY